MYKCGNYIPEAYTDCYYEDDRCCFYCDKENTCAANSRCSFNCYDDDDDNPDDTNAYWVEEKE